MSIDVNSTKIDEILNFEIDLLEWLMEKKKSEMDLKIKEIKDKNQLEINENQPQIISEINSHTISNNKNHQEIKAEIPPKNSFIQVKNQSKITSKSKGQIQAKPLYNSDTKLVLLQKGCDAINELLDLEAPKFSKQLFGYLDLEDALEFFISKITLLSDDEEEFHGLIPTLTKERSRIPSSNDTMIAYRAMELLCSTNYFAKRLFIVMERRLIPSLIKLCLPSALGSFYHLRKIFHSALVKCPNAISILLEARPDGPPLLLHLLSNIINSPVQDMIITLFVKINTKANAPLKSDFAEKLVECRFMEHLLQLIVDGGLSLSLNHTNIPEIDGSVQECCLSVLKRIFLTSVPHPPDLSKAPDLSKEGPELQFYLTDKLISSHSLLIQIAKNASGFTQDHFVYIELFHLIITLRQDLVSEIKDILVPILMENLVFFGRILKSSSVSLGTKLMTLDLLIIFLNQSQEPSEKFLVEIPWSQLLEDFFNKHRKCTMYLGKMTRIVQEIIFSSHHSSILDEAITCGFFHRLVDTLHPYHHKMICKDDLYAYSCACLALALKSPLLVDRLSQSVPDWPSNLDAFPDGPLNLIHVLTMGPSELPEIKAIPSRCDVPVIIMGDVSEETAITPQNQCIPIE